MTDARGLRARLIAGEPIVGTFVKTPAPQVVELLGRAGLDFVVADAEHAPLDLTVLDAMAMAALASVIALVVRVPRLDPAWIGACLDLGATGILVPHIGSPEDARGAVAAMKYASGRRGFSPSTRAADYGAAAAGYRDRADASTSLWCQIEDAGALSQLDAIAGIEGVDCLFLGPADLAASLGLASPADPGLAEPTRAIAAACRRHARAAGLFVSDRAMIAPARSTGYSVIVCGSDQSLIGGEARAIVDALRAVGGTSAAAFPIQERGDLA